MTFSVTQNGKPLSKDKYTWDPKTKTFSTKENDLVLDFTGMNGVTFNTGGGCTFSTGGGCTFNTGGGCTFNTGGDCTFNTGGGCTFNADGWCTFTCEENCFVTRWDVKGVTEIPEGKTIKLRGYGVEGYDEVKPHVIVIDGKEITLSEESYEELKKSLS